MKFVLLVISIMFYFARCDGEANVAQNNMAKPATTVSPTPNRSPGFLEKTEKKMDKETLVKRVEPLDETASRIIGAESSQIQETDSSFLRDGKIYKVSKFAPTRRIIIYVGIIGTDYTALIGDEKKYFEFAKKAKVVLANDELRKAYVLNFLEVTKSGGKRLQILESIGDIKARPNLTENQKQAFAEFEKKYESVIKPPKQSGEATYKVFAVYNQNLVQLELTVMPDGRIETKETILERNLPIPYAI